jgi:transposase InsO family protein/predicted aspartyl protease
MIDDEFANSPLLQAPSLTITGLSKPPCTFTSSSTQTSDDVVASLSAGGDESRLHSQSDETNSHSTHASEDVVASQSVGDDVSLISSKPDILSFEHVMTSDFLYTVEFDTSTSSVQGVECSGQATTLSFAQALVSVGDVTLQHDVMLDTGFTGTAIISRDIAETLSRDTISSTKQTLANASGERISVRGVIDIDVAFGSFSTRITALVSNEHLSQNFIIGLGFLQHCTLDYQQGLLRLPNKTDVRILTPFGRPLNPGTAHSGDLITARNCLLKPGSHSVIPVHTDNPDLFNKDCGTSVFTITDDVVCPASIIHLDSDGNGLIPVTNTLHSKTYMLKSHQVVSNVTLVDIQSLDSEAKTGRIQEPSPLPSDPVTFTKDNGDTFELNVPRENRKQIIELLQQFTDVWATGNDAIGEVPIDFGGMMGIDTYDDTPVNAGTRRQNPVDSAIIKENVKVLEQQGVITPSDSSYCAPILMVHQRTKARMCVDFRKLNAHTKPVDTHLPLMQYLIDSLAGKKFFTVLDVKSAYHNLRIRPEDQHKTAFGLPSGLKYHYLRAPFGLKGTPAKWSAIMLQAFKDHPAVYIYLDDIIVVSDTIEEHLQHLEHALQIVRKLNVRLAPSKAKIAQRSVVYLGYLVGEHGISIDPLKVQDLRSKPVPSSYAELSSALACFGIYRHFVQDFATKVETLRLLLIPSDSMADELRALNKKRKSQGKQPVSRKNAHLHRYLAPFKDAWLEKHSETFISVRDELCDATALSHPDFQREFWIATDASKYLWGAVLFQYGDNGLKRPVSFASGKFSSAQANYSATERELMAIINAIDKYRTYFSTTVNVVTDHGALQHLHGIHSKRNQRLESWALALSHYHLNIHHLAGSQHSDADYMSRWDKLPESRQQLPPSVVFNTISHQLPPSPQALTRHALTAIIAADEFIVLSQSLQPDDTLFNFQRFDRRDRARNIDQVTPVNMVPLSNYIKHHQKQDAFCKLVGAGMAEEITFSDYFKAAPIDDFHMTSNGIFYKQIKTVSRKSELVDNQAVIVPACLVKAVLSKFHDQTGHLGFTSTLHTIRSRYFWPGMYSDVRQYVSTCDACQRRKPAASRTAPGTIQLVAQRPFQVLCTDFVQVISPSSAQPTYCILTITDMFTRYTRLYPCRDQTALTFLHHLSEWISTFTYPERVLSDNGAAFTATITQQQLTNSGIAQSLIAPLNPQGNSIAERINRPILDMLSTLAKDDPHNWLSKLGLITNMLNARPHFALDGITPFEALTGTRARMHDDFLQPFPDDPTTPRQRLVSVEAIRSYIRQHLATKYVESPVTEQPRYKPGDKVLTKFNPKQRAKLNDKFGNEVTIVEAIPNTNGGYSAYVVKDQDNKSFVISPSRLRPFRRRRYFK